MKPKSLRKAALLNTIWPGSGQFYLGQIKLGLGMAALFGALFLAAIVLFLKGMKVYFDLTLDGNILEGDRLERIGNAFAQRWLIGLMIAGLVVYVVSLAALWFAPPETGGDEPATPAKPPILPPLLPK